MIVRPRVPSSVAIAVTLSLALLPLADVLTGFGWFVRLALGAVVAVVCTSTIETLLPRRERPILTMATLAGAVLWSLVVVRWADFFANPLSGSVWGDVLDGFFSGWSELLSVSSPTADQQAAETFLVFLVWAAAAAATRVAATRRSPLVAVLLAGALLWVSAAAALPAGTASVLLGLLAGMGALVTIAAITRNETDEWASSRLGALAAMVALAAIVAGLVTVVTDPIQRDPYDPRTAQDVTFQSVELPDLLAEYGARRNDAGVMFEVDFAVDDPGIPLRFRLQTYGVHDGRRFLPATEYTQVGQLGDQEVIESGTSVTLDITMRRLDAPFLPLLDRTAGLDIESLGWDPASQTAIRTEQPATYRLTGSVIELAQVDATTVDREVGEPFLDLPDTTPESLRAQARAIAGAATSDRDGVETITELVRSLGRDETVPAGHALGRLRADLDDRREASAEQLGALQTFLLRAAGYPARLVVGYQSEGGAVVATDLHVWVEVAFTDVGWVATEPVPALDAEPELPPETATTTTLPTDSAIAAQAQPRELGPSESPSEVSTPGDGITLADLVPVFFGLLALAFLLLIAARGRRRMRRRRARSHDVRTLGAWAELVDRLREAGAPIDDTSTIDDVVGFAGDVEESLAPPAESLGRLAAQVFHGPRPAGNAEATKAWRHLESAEQVLRETHGRRVTARRVLDPRVLRYRDPEPPPHRHGGRRTDLLTRR